MAARAAYLAGFEATATVAAGALWGIPLSGTMAHAFIQSFDDEAAAFEAFATSRPEGLVFLLDTYDTEAAARKVAALAPRLAARGVRIHGVRLDSGDLDALARSVRAILDDAGLTAVIIIASGGLDEDDLARFAASRAPIDAFGIGTSLTTSSDAPALDCVYKLEVYAGLPRRKHSTGKTTWPGAKQVFRRYDAAGRMSGDLLTTADDAAATGQPLLAPVMRQGRRIPGPTLERSRALAAAELARLPEPLRRLEPHPYPVEVSPSLQALAAATDRRLGL
jgi:nicotinate phosphoribosyltransferase